MLSGQFNSHRKGKCAACITADTDHIDRAVIQNITTFFDRKLSESLVQFKGEELTRRGGGCETWLFIFICDFIWLCCGR